MDPVISLLTSPLWTEYELLDSGDGQKLERFGPYTFARPEVQAIWTRNLPAASWDSAHAVFQPSGEESGGHWSFKKKVPEQWEMSYPLDLSSDPSPKKSGKLMFSVMTTPGRHLGVFPECAAHWDWMAGLINDHHGVNQQPGDKQKTSSSGFSSPPGIEVTGSPINVLNLFGYTGLASLTCAAVGAKVTHVDASKKSVTWARANQAISGLAKKPVRWIVDDALKFVERESRRGIKYDGILLDPP